MIKSTDFFSKLSVKKHWSIITNLQGLWAIQSPASFTGCFATATQGMIVTAGCDGKFCSVDTQGGALCLHLSPSEMENTAAVHFMQPRVQEKGGICPAWKEETKFRCGHVQDFLSDISKCQAVHETKLRGAALWPCRNICGWCSTNLHFPTDL